MTIDDGARAFLENAANAVTVSGKTGTLTHAADESVLLDARGGLLVHHPAEELPIDIPGVLSRNGLLHHRHYVRSDGSWRTRLCGSFMIRLNSAATPSNTARFSFIRLE
ncbi:hypothetical protein ABIF97_000658 [Bradyrhizobium japonicum]